MLLVCVLPLQSAHEAAGAAGTRHSPRPPGGERFMHDIARRDRGATSDRYKCATLSRHTPRISRSMTIFARERCDAQDSVIPGRATARTSDVQLHIGESRDSGSGPSDHPGMTASELSVTSLLARTVILRESGVTSTPWLLASIIGVSGILDRPLSRATTAENLTHSYA